MKAEEHYQIELENQERALIELTNKINEVNENIAKLRLDKELMESQLIDLIDHRIEGSKTYDIGIHSVTIKTDMIYSLDKKAYCNGEVFLPDSFDPIIQKTTYEVNKKLFNIYEQTAPMDVRLALADLVEKKPSKPNVSIRIK